MATEVANLKTESPVKAPAHVFIVDDEVMVGEIVETILNLEGFKARFFSCPVEALREFLSAEPRPDVLLSDYVMTPMNGMELIGRCKQAQPALHTILYSGNVDEDILGEYDRKPDAFLTKPFLPKTLVRTVQKVLEKQSVN